MAEKASPSREYTIDTADCEIFVYEQLEVTFILMLMLLLLYYYYYYYYYYYHLCFPSLFQFFNTSRVGIFTMHRCGLSGDAAVSPIAAAISLVRKEVTNMKSPINAMAEGRFRSG
mmetsp:Transcript_12473/g.20016  ORF Transcript_12473/g.20016 Transcript_12473/m.20016 type:complete len:115 (+) Transcript_12473:530-874(+)